MTESSAVRIYDITRDEFRPVTERDVRLMVTFSKFAWKVARETKRVEELEALIAQAGADA